MADKAYNARKIYQYVDEKLDGKAYIPFKKGTTEKAKGTYAWTRMYHAFHQKRGKFRRHYHQRSTVEAAFSGLKQKFRAHLTAKKQQSLRNQLLSKVLAHNICTLIRSLHELDIDKPGFSTTTQ
jgi:transposase